MFTFFSKYFKRKHMQECWIAAKNRKQIIDRLEQYYTDIATGAVVMTPRKLAIAEFERAKSDGRLDKLNRIVKRK